MALARLLAALDDAVAPAAQDAFAPTLGGWFDWTDAIALSAALDSPAATPPDRGAAYAAAALAVEEREVERVRRALRRQVADGLPLPSDGAPATAGFDAWRAFVLDRQQAMEAAIAPLRRRLRAALEDTSPALARLAALDVVMEKVIGVRERVLLASLPSWLGHRFERLVAPVDGAPDAAAPDAAATTAALARFARELRDVLLAELDLRLQPIEGLLAALRCPSPASP